MKKQISPKIVSLVFAVLVVGFLAVFYVFAWTEPTETPPGGNVSAPINVSSVDQIKQGSLSLNTAGISPTGLIVNRDAIFLNGNVGIGTTAPVSALDVKGTLRLSGSTSGYVGFASAAAAGSTTYTLPSADGSSGQVLSTSGTGVLSWAASMSPAAYAGEESITFPNGLIIKQGSVVATGGSQTVTFGVAFPTQSLRVVPIQVAAAGVWDANIKIVSKSAINFVVYTSGSMFGTIDWIAIGY